MHLNDINCMYCTKNEKLLGMMILVCYVDGHPLYLHRNQANPGRCILAYKEHIATIADIPEEAALQYFHAAYKVTRALKAVFNPDQTNLGAFGDLTAHVHLHFAPKFQGGQDFGKPFQVNPQPPQYLTEEGYQGVISNIKDALEDK